MKKTAIIFITLLLLVATLSGCGSSASTAEDLTMTEGVLTIGVDNTYPPMEYNDEETGELVGFDVDLANAIAEKMSLEVNFVSTAWDAIFIGLDTEKYDCIMSSVSMTAERLENFEFTNPYLANGQVIVVKPGDESVQTPEDLEGKKVGVQLETTADTACQKHQASGVDFDLVQYDSIDLAFLAMKSGNVDCIVVDMAVAINYAAKYPDDYVISSASLTNEPISICIKKGNTELKDAMQTALDEVIADGTLAEISVKWLGADYTANIDTELRE
jgi:polar amino acid transport system substrate-binding protein